MGINTLNWLPIVHVPDARQPGDILVAAPPNSAYDAYVAEDTQDNKHGNDGDEHNKEDQIGHHWYTRESAGHGPIKPSDQRGNDRV